jgi:hypothetical protein
MDSLKGLRGGHHQKRKRRKHVIGDAESQDPSSTVAFASWSPLGFKLLEKWAWGEISASVLVSHIYVMSNLAIVDELFNAVDNFLWT